MKLAKAQVLHLSAGRRVNPHLNLLHTPQSIGSASRHATVLLFMGIKYEQRLTQVNKQSALADWKGTCLKHGFYLILFKRFLIVSRRLKEGDVSLKIFRVAERPSKFSISKAQSCHQVGPKAAIKC